MSKKVVVDLGLIKTWVPIAIVFLGMLSGGMVFEDFFDLLHLFN